MYVALNSTFFKYSLVSKDSYTHWFQKIVQILLSANLDNLLKFKKIFFWFISVKKWFQTNYFGAAAQKTVESVKNTRSAAPNPPCCEILASKDSSNLAERKFR